MPSPMVPHHETLFGGAAFGGFANCPSLLASSASRELIRRWMSCGILRVSGFDVDYGRDESGRAGSGGKPKSPRSSPDAVRFIDLLAFPAVQLLDVTGPLQVFASANDIVVDAGGSPPYTLRLVAQGGQGVTASAGLALAAEPLPPADAAVDTLMVAGGQGVDAAAADVVLVDWVRERAA